MLDIITVQVGLIEENCYIIYERKVPSADAASARGWVNRPANGADRETQGQEETGGTAEEATRQEGTPSPCVVIDPGDQATKIKYELDATGLRPEAILLTHAHFDHIGAVQGLRSYFPDIPIYAHKDERIIIDNPKYNGGSWSHKPNKWAESVVYLDDRAELRLLGEKWVLLHTPGHTTGSCCYYIDSMHYLFAGDTLFAGSCGRTDLPTGSMRALVNSIQQVLMALPDKTIVFPGHMECTSIGAEKRYNFIMRM